MQPLCYIAFILLCSVHFLSAEVSTLCSETQYAWPVDAARHCCNKCPPGQRMARRSLDSCKITCETCLTGRYLDSYNVDMTCSVCKNCKKPNMEYTSPCTSAHDAVCRCKAGYRCKDQPCTECVSILTTTKPTLPICTTTREALTAIAPSKPVTGTVWLLMITACLCTGIAFVVVTTVKSIRSKNGYILTEKPATASEDEGVSKPVQEVCGKCDQPIDV